MIHHLSLQHFRCFSNLELTFTPGINLIHGANGSGKTSILESVYIAGRGRSFRTNYLSDLIHRDNKDAVVYVEGMQKDNRYRIGCQILPSSLSVKLNQKILKSRISLLDFLPLQIITPVSHQLVDSGSTNRRKFIDWGLFHVEPSYRKVWSQFHRILKQRNQALKQNRSDISIWNEQFVNLSHQLNIYHDQYFKQLDKYFMSIQLKLTEEKLATIKHFAGWNKDAGLEHELDRSRESDLKRGFTHYGPHKADIKFDFLESKRNVLSRGQQKMLVFSLQLAQCLHLHASTGSSPIILIDDISSELDSNYLNRLVKTLNELKLQSMVSVIDPSILNTNEISTMFHVEHQ